MRRVRRVAVLCAAGLFASLMASGGTATAQTTNYDVQVGAPHEDTPSESMRFLPSRLRVHRGDTITFAGGFHTATLLPEEADAQEWVDDNVVPADGPYTPFAADPDEGPDALKFNNAVAFPSNPTCGGPGGSPCTYDGSSLVSSGVFVFGPGSFTTTVDVPAGESFWVICLIHSNMRMRVTVVADDQPASTQAEIDQARERQIAHDADEAAALHHRLLTKRSKHTTPAGKTVWDAWVGYDLPGVSLLAMYPRKLTIAKGDTVRYHFGSLEYEVHTATFPLRKGLEISNSSFVPSCDPDGDTGTEADSPPQTEAPPFCNDPTQLELDLDPRMMDDGNGVLKSASDFESSRVRGDFLTRTAWDLRFAAKSPAGGFEYVCMIHPFMRGSVVAK